MCSEAAVRSARSREAWSSAKADEDATEDLEVFDVGGVRWTETGRARRSASVSGAGTTTVRWAAGELTTLRGEGPHDPGRPVPPAGASGGSTRVQGVGEGPQHQDPPLSSHRSG